MTSIERAFRPIKVIDIELGDRLSPLTGLQPYTAVHALVRLHGTPLELVRVPVKGGVCSATTIRRAILGTLAGSILVGKVHDALDAGLGRARPDDAPERPPAPLPSVTVAVCTRNRPDDLARCLAAVERLEHPDLEVVVVDNSPSTEQTRELVESRFPKIRYVREPRPGLDWARNRAIAEARGEVIAFTDDDVVVDPGWALALASVFAMDDGVMAVTGLVVPLELETHAQMLFERSGGFGRGFHRTWYRLSDEVNPSFHLGPGKFGTGANMAFRSTIFEEVGAFDTALGAGTATNGGDDLEMFFRVLQEGHVLVYEPAAVVRHRHRRDYESLRVQLSDHGLALYAFIVRSARAYPELRGLFIRFGVWWLWRRSLRRLLISYLRPSRMPRDLIIAELRGSLIGLTRYGSAKREAARIARSEPLLEVAT
jgi:GT2 family glycosyltransferase